MCLGEEEKKEREGRKGKKKKKKKLEKAGRLAGSKSKLRSVRLRGAEVSQVTLFVM